MECLIRVYHLHHLVYHSDVRWHLPRLCGSNRSLWHPVVIIANRRTHHINYLKANIFSTVALDLGMEVRSLELLWTPGRGSFHGLLYVPCDWPKSLGRTLRRAGPRGYRSQIPMHLSNAEVHMSVLLAQIISDLSWSTPSKPDKCWPYCRSGSQACCKQEMTIFGHRIVHMTRVDERVNNCWLLGTRGYRVLVYVFSITNASLLAITLLRKGSMLHLDQYQSF